MFVKLTSKNRLTLAKEIVKSFPGVDYFDVRAQDGRIVLEPVVPSRVDEVRRRLEQLGLGKTAVADAIIWARRDPLSG